MRAREFIALQIGRQRWVADSALQGLTEEQLNWTPPGETNTIGTILLHVTGTDDRFVNVLARGGQAVWERDNWAERVGFPGIPGRAGFWAEANAHPFALSPLLAYQAAVRASLDEYVAALTDEELSRTMQALGSEQPIAAILGLVVVHQAHHFGEIAALKGAQGVKGLPF